jgi:hypothetical protein
VTLRSHHLADNRLYDCYFAKRNGEVVDRITAEHVASCESCAARCEEIGLFLNELREEGEFEADTIFTPERLHAQQRQIASRIGHIGRAARVINFPQAFDDFERPFAGATIMASTSYAASRWVAAAAAAGLFIGVALGASYKFERRGFSATPPPAIAHAAVQPSLVTALAARASSPTADIAADDAFLSELEMAHDRPRPEELRALDALTPHVREVRDFR